MESFEPFLRSTEVVDWSQPAVLAKARELSLGAAGRVQIARRCFEWVRDEIQHSNDFHRNPVTCSASETLLAGTGAPFSLHGLNVVHLPEFGWYRIDSRGNKPGVDAQFRPPVEELAFHLNFPEERSFPDILPDPLPAVVDALHSQSTWDAMLANLPDWDRPTLEL